VAVESDGEHPRGGGSPYVIGVDIVFDGDMKVW
jgi:hypothetical protein